MSIPTPKLGDGPWIMGILNVTPDSFFDGGARATVRASVDAAERMLDCGADIIDVGGESTRPGAAPVREDEEKRRVLPVIELLRRRRPEAAISIDTMKPAVARAAVQAGAAMWNDVTALAYAPNSIETAADLGCAVVLMHMQGDPRTMQANPVYDDVAHEVAAFLEERAQIAQGAGVRPENIWVDPGIGFGKTLAHNLELVRGVAHVRAHTGRRLVFGASRKGFIGMIEVEAGAQTASPAAARLGGSLSAALAAWEFGADMLRVHDVAETVQALRVWLAIGRDV